MAEPRLLMLVLRYPNPRALARRAPGGRLFPALRRLEARGLVTRRRGEYRLTKRGREELTMAHALLRLLARTDSARP
jgi:predicted transcriptional regulator